MFSPPSNKVDGLSILDGGGGLLSQAHFLAAELQSSEGGIHRVHFGHTVQVAFNGPLKGDGNKPEKAVEDAEVDLCKGELEQGWGAKSNPLVGCGVSCLGGFGCWGRESIHGSLARESSRTVGAFFSRPHFEWSVGRGCALLECPLCVPHLHLSPTSVCEDGAKVLLLGIAQKAAIVV